MNWLTLVIQIIEVCIIPLLGLLTGYLIDYIKTKTNSAKLDKYVDMLNDTITECVLATKQTYVEALKKNGNFDETAQKEAFEKTKQAVMDILNADAKEYLTTIYGDLNAYVNQKIESEVNLTK
jgi:hypothetical protein